MGVSVVVILDNIAKAFILFFLCTRSNYIRTAPEECGLIIQVKLVALPNSA